MKNCMQVRISFRVAFLGQIKLAKSNKKTIEFGSSCDHTGSEALCMNSLWLGVFQLVPSFLSDEVRRVRPTILNVQSTT